MGFELTVSCTVRFVQEKLVWVIGCGELLAVNGEHVITFLHVHSHFRKRRAVFLLLILPAKDFADAIAARCGIQFKSRAG